MRFSIVIPTYNGAAYIEEALQSALQQQRQADEIIVSDDNSSDQTLAICEKYKNRIRIYTNHQGPSGFVNGWNKAIAHATGDYIAILHQDDRLAPDFLAEIEHAIRKYPQVKHLFTPCNYIDQSGNLLQTADYCDGSTRLYTREAYIEAYQQIGHPHIHRCPGVVTHRSIFQKCNYRTEAGHIADDDFFYRVGEHTDIVGVLKPLAAYRLHASSETGRLKNYDLIQRLARDYLFQLNYWHKNPMVTPRLWRYIVNHAARFAWEEAVYGIQLKDKALLQDGISNIRKITSIDKNIPRKIRWFYTGYKILKNMAI